MKIKGERDQIVQSPLGKKRLDNTGAAIGAARMKADEAYGAIPLLLKEYINNNSESAWSKIRVRIDNVYRTVSHALEALDAEESFSNEISNLLKSGKKLCFTKPKPMRAPTKQRPTTAMVIQRCRMQVERKER